MKAINANNWRLMHQIWSQLHGLWMIARHGAGFKCDASSFWFFPFCSHTLFSSGSRMINYHLCKTKYVIYWGTSYTTIKNPKSSLLHILRVSGGTCSVPASSFAPGMWSFASSNKTRNKTCRRWNKRTGEMGSKTVLSFSSKRNLPTL